MRENALPARTPMIPLSQRLREETHELHVIAERSGIMRPLLRGKLEPFDYGRLLRNLHPIYAALENRIRDDRGDALPESFRHPGLARLTRLERDLATIAGAAWELILGEPTATAQRYASRLMAASPTDVVAHGYVRYLGDLSGGQHIARIVSRSLGADYASAIGFYDFAELGDVDAFKAKVRIELDQLPLSDDASGDVVREARWAFAAHADLFNELHAAVDDLPSRDRN